MGSIKTLLCVCVLSLTLSGCAALQMLQSLGGGTSSKGHGNDNTVLVGSDQSNGLSTGGKTDIDAENVGGDLTGRDKKDVSVKRARDVTVNHGIPWWVWVILSLLIPSPVEKLYRFISSLVRRKRRDR
jgi:hypothetical protein